MNSTSSDLALQLNEASELQNVDFNRFGSIIKRAGFSQLNAVTANSGATWVGLHWFQLVDGTDFLVGVAGDQILKMDALDGTFDDITGGLTITAGDNNLVDSITFRDTWLATNGVDAPFQWSGTGNAVAMTVPTGLTRASFIEVFQNFTILANVTVSASEFKSRVFWSSIGEIGTWDSADFNDVFRDDGTVITGLKTLGDELIIFKELAIHKATFTGDRDIPFVFTKTRSNVGAIAGHSVQEVENGLIFLSRDGYYFFDGNNSFKISDRINVTLEGFSQSRQEFSASAYQQTRNRYWSTASEGSASQHDRIVTWDSFNNAFSLYLGHSANVFAIVNTSGEERVYFGDYAGFVYQADDGVNDNPAGTETAVDFKYKTRWFDHTDIVNQKGVPHIYIYFQLSSTILTFGYSYDFEEATQFTQTFTLSPGGAVYGSAIYGIDVYGSSGGAVRRRDMAGRGRVIRFEFSNAVLDESVQLDGFGTLPYLETQV